MAKVALLLDCDDAMAEAIAKVPPGYEVHRWETGAYEDGDPLELPIRGYEADLIVDDVRRPPLYDVSASDVWPKLGGRPSSEVKDGAEMRPEDGRIDLRAEGIWSRRDIRERYRMSDKTLQRMDRAVKQNPKQKAYPGWRGPCGEYKGRPVYEASMVRECEYLRPLRLGSVDSASIARPEDYMTSTDDEQV